MIRLPKPDQTRSEGAEVGSIHRNQRASRERRGNVASKAGQVTSGSDCLSFHFKCELLRSANFVFPIVYHVLILSSISHPASISARKRGFVGARRDAGAGAGSGRQTFFFPLLIPTQVEDEECLSPPCCDAGGLFASVSASGNFTSSYSSSTFIVTSGRRGTKTVDFALLGKKRAT